MAGALRKTMVYLGLAEDQGRYDDEYYEGYDEHVEVEEQPEHRGAEVTHLQTRHAGGARRALARRRSASPGSRRSTRAPTTRPRRSARTSATASRSS